MSELTENELVEPLLNPDPDFRPKIAGEQESHKGLPSSSPKKDRHYTRRSVSISGETTWGDVVERSDGELGVVCTDRAGVYRVYWLDGRLEPTLLDYIQKPYRIAQKFTVHVEQYVRPANEPAAYGYDVEQI